MFTRSRPPTPSWAGSSSRSARRSPADISTRPNGFVQTLVVLVAIGFPIALVIAWAFELTPEGIKRTEDVDLAASARQPRKYTWIFVVIVGAALSVGLFFIGRYTGRTTTSAAGTELPAKSIAVLPFESLSEDKSNAYFAEGVQDEILTRLAKVADLKVISRTSTQHFKSAPDNLPADREAARRDEHPRRQRAKSERSGARQCAAH